MRGGPLLLLASLAAAATTAAPAAVADDPPKRPTPDYDGRAEPGATPGEVLVWVPRIIVYPVYLVSEYVLRQGLSRALDTAEDLRAESETEDTFGFTPSLALETDRRPVFGAMAIWREAGAKKHTVRGYAGFGGIDWLRGIVASRLDLDEGAELTARGEAMRRPDGIYWGIGPDAPEEQASRYGRDSFEAAFAARVPAASHLRMWFDLGVRRDRFDGPACCAEAGLVGRVARGEVAAPPGFEGFTRLRQGLSMEVDTRDDPGERATGLSLRGDAAHAIDIESPSLDRWLRWGGRLTGEVDVTGTGRMLGLSLDARFADPFAGGEVPFVELASVGGDETMRAFGAGRLLGRSATVATLGWRWPLWPYAEGRTHVAVGTVAGEHLDGWDAGDMRLSFDLGLHTEPPSPDDWQMELLLGLGTERFEEGTDPETFRLLFAVIPRF